MAKDMQLAKRLNRGNTNNEGLFAPEGAERKALVISNMVSVLIIASISIIAPAPIVAPTSIVASAPIILPASIILPTSVASFISVEASALAALS